MSLLMEPLVLLVPRCADAALTRLAQAALCGLGLWAGTYPTGHAAEVYRCGDVYTNVPLNAQDVPCQPLSGGHVSVMGRTKSSQPHAAQPEARAPSASPADSAAGVRAILQAELTLARQRLQAASAGSPEAQRAQDDIDGLQREMARWSKHTTP